MKLLELKEHYKNDLDKVISLIKKCNYKYKVNGKMRIGSIDRQVFILFFDASVNPKTVQEVIDLYEDRLVLNFIYEIIAVDEEQYEVAEGIKNIRTRLTEFYIGLIEYMFELSKKDMNKVEDKLWGMNEYLPYFTEENNIKSLIKSL